MAAAPATEARSVVVGTLLSFGLFLLVALSSGGVARLRGSAPPSSLVAAAAQAADTNYYATQPNVVATVTLDDLLEYEDVQTFLAEQGVDYATATRGQLLNYVPSDVVFQIWADEVHGDIGAYAAEGYVAFDAAFQDDDGDVTASYVFVVDLHGSLVSVIPTVWGDTVYRALGLKMKDNETLLMALGEGSSLKGKAYEYKWHSKEWLVMGDGVKEDSHDVQISYSSAKDYWVPYDDGFRLMDGTGAVAAEHVVHEVGDINHVQLIEEDAYAIVSSRLTDGIIKIDTSKSDTNEANVVWTVGGMNGDYVLYDLDGTKYHAGHSLWVGQHNAEYFGDDEYMMFDNQYEQGGVSRMLIVEVDESAKTATLVWEHNLTSYTPHFGDCDRLPNGNLLGSWWPQKIEASSDFQFDTQALEVTRSGSALAWQVSVVGKGCASGKCERSSGQGWTTYSAERFYSHPLAWSFACSLDASSGNALSFKVSSAFKEADLRSGTYAVEVDGEDLVSGDVDFKPHWRENAVTTASMKSQKGPTFAGTVKVFDRWGQKFAMDVDLACV